MRAARPHPASASVWPRQWWRGPAAPFVVFEIDNPTRAGPVILVPLLHDEAVATWVVRIDTSMGMNRQNTQSEL